MISNQNRINLTEINLKYCQVLDNYIIVLNSIWNKENHKKK